MTSAQAGIAHQPYGKTTIEYLPLEEVRVKAWVVDVSSRIVLTQTFYNPSDEPTGRAKYVFPLPANAAVCAFELELEDGSVIVGEVKGKEEATLDFNRAVAQGRTAALVERVTDDIFTISVGSIPGTTRVVAHLTFVMDLLDEALRDHVRLQLPMYVARRYGTPPAAMRDASSADSRTRVDIRVDVQMSDVIYDIRSPTHPIVLRRYRGRSNNQSRRRMSAVWKSSGFLTSDFVIVVHAEGLDRPRCFAEVLDVTRGRDGGGSTIAIQLTLVPKFQAPKIPSQEYIFIIDRSSSMIGASIDTAKRTLTMLLRLLPSAQTTFNIFSFASEVTSLWPSSRELDQTSLGEAISHVASMSTYVGTEIPNALQAAFNSRGLDRPAVVFLLTDGQVYGNEELDPWVVISNAIRDSQPEAPVRLFVLGIGTGVSSDVCSSLARQGNGEYLFALCAEDICGKCACLLNAGRSKNIERVDIDWGNDALSSQASFSFPETLNLPALEPPPSVQQAPHMLAKIFSGIRFTVFAIASFRSIPTSVRLMTKLEGEPEVRELILHVTKVKPFRDTNEHSVIPIVHTLAARRLIMELDDGTGPLPRPVSGDALLASENDLRRAGTVRLGLTYQLVSKHTSFVAVQDENERARNKGRATGSMVWARPGLGETDANTRADSPAEGATFLDNLVRGVSSLMMSVFGLFSSSVASTNVTPRSRTHHGPRFPGAYDRSDSDVSESSGGHGRRRASSPLEWGRSSTDTFSTLSSLEGSSSCSSCWTYSRPPTPLQSLDPIERAPSPDFHQDRRDGDAPGDGDPRAIVSNGIPNRTRAPISVPQEVYELFEQMALDGSFSASPLLTRLVGDAILGKADELGVDDDRVWTTVVVVAYMKIHLRDEPNLFELVSDKAREFVAARAGQMGDGERSFDRMVREVVALLNP